VVGVLDRVRRRVAYAMAGSNVAGGIVVFLFGTLALPNPAGLHHVARLQILNLALFVVAMSAAVLVVWKVSRRLWLSRLEWISADRAPSERELELTLRFPLTQQAINAAGWIAAAMLFGAVNAPFSGELAGNVAVAILLGGLVTCALGYLLGERLMRPLTALVLARGVPSRPQLPGVAARALLSWTLGTGVVLVGLALVGIGGLHEARFTRERLAVLIVVLSAIGLLVGLLSMVGLARSLADPITALRRAASRVEQGDLDKEVEVDDGSEVGLLQAGFNRMVAGLRERERIRDLFGRQVGEDVVRHALERGVELGGEAREAAVLFVDLQGSTALAQTRDPTEVVALLNRFFAIVVEVVAAHDGWVNKFEGDAALCAFGVPLPDPGAATNALAAARDLQSRLPAELPELSAGIGVSAGRVVAGNIGAASRFEYTVIGDPVNEAARLTELAKTHPERVLASDAALARAQADEAERWRLGEPLQLRGRAEPTVVAAPMPLSERQPL
jgi:adenylate cyclase